MTRHSPRILLVNDQPEEAMALWQSLTESGQADVQVDVVPDLAQALARLTAGPVEAVVLDLNLPDSHGLDTLRCVRAAAGATPVIVIAQSASTTLREAALAAGAEEVYDKQDVNSGLVSHSVLYVMDRQRAQKQHLRLQLLLETVPEAVVIADTEGVVRFANPAAQTLLGHPEAAVGDLIDFGGSLDDVAEVLVCQGLHTLRCEVRLAAVEWDGLEARLASVRPLGAHPEPDAAPANHTPARMPRAQRAEQAARLQQQVLSDLSQHISTQIQAVSGLRSAWEHTGQGPLQSCYSRPLQPQLLSALRTAAASASAALPGLRGACGRG